jgi:photosynthetic reaction center cytochrome c subunit
MEAQNMMAATRRNILNLAIFATALAVLIMTAFRVQFETAEPIPAQAVPSRQAPQAKTAGEAFKNIQVLKDIPAEELIPSMQFISASLGVGCSYCHLQNGFDKDDKQPKQAARKMIRMMFAINQENFSGRRLVTCYSCHHGSTHPVAIPIIPEAGAGPEMAAGMNAEEAGPAAGAASLPAPDQLIDKYVQALGGAEALRKVSTRVEKGTVSGFGGHEFPVEVYAKAPYKRMSVVEMLHGESITAYNGEMGWMEGMGRPARPMSGADLPVARLDADFYFPLHIKQEFSSFRTLPPEKIGNHQADVVALFKPGQPPVRLYFDPQSGLLVRLIHYQATPLGLNPIQIDYAKYREVDGTKVPFKWTIARPGGRFTIKIDQIQQNIPIDDQKFDMPGAPSPTAQEPSMP